MSQFIPSPILSQRSQSPTEYRRDLAPSDEPEAVWDDYYFSPEKVLQTAHQQAGVVVAMELCGHRVEAVHIAKRDAPIRDCQGSPVETLGRVVASSFLFAPPTVEVELRCARLNGISHVEPLVRQHWDLALNLAFIMAGGAAAEAFHTNCEIADLAGEMADNPEEHPYLLRAFDAVAPFIPDEGDRAKFLWRVWCHTYDYLDVPKFRCAITAVAEAALDGASADQMRKLIVREVGSLPRQPITYPKLRRWRSLVALPEAARAWIAN